jgi:hypothetical protein
VPTSDDGDVRAPSSAGGAGYCAQIPIRFASARISPTVLLSNVSRATELASVRLLARYRVMACPLIGPRLFAGPAHPENRGVGQKSIDPTAQQQLPFNRSTASTFCSTPTDPDGAVLVRPDGHVAWRSGSGASNPLEVLRGAFDGLSGRMPAMA